MKSLIMSIVGAVLLAGTFAAAFAAGGLIGVQAGRHAVQKEAVEVGAGRWIEDDAGRRCFFWTH